MKMKLLSPAGDLDSLKMAVVYGADEVYLGVKNFNARNIEGFNLETLKQATEFAHIYGVKIHLAVNILFENEELQDALNLIIDANNIGVDAFIIQDLGLASLLHKHYPNIEMHASTQMGIHNLEGALFAKKLGFKRIVLSRETPLNEIKRIKDNCDIEIEYFAQGALCVSFSGNCYLSSKLFNASGNRGKCKQLCRLPFTLSNNNKKIKSGYLLSAKDFNMLNRLKDLENAGVDAIKIEGRARRPYYVAVATKLYRQALDEQNYDVKKLMLAFNREFTEGYFNGNSNIISKYNNHIGIEIGNVYKVNFGKKFNEIYFTSSEKLNKKSVIKLFKNSKEISTISLYDLKEIAPNKYYATTMQKVEQNATVRLISDYDEEISTTMQTKKLPVNIKIVAKSNLPIFCTVNYKNISFSVEGDVCLEALNQPLSSEDFVACFNKNEFFNPNLNLDISNIFLTKKQLNEFRRTVYDKLIEKLIAKENLLNKTTINLPTNIKKFNNFQVVDNISEEFINQNIILDPEIYNVNIIQKFVNKCKIENKKPYLMLPNFALKADIDIIQEIIEKTKIAVIANNYYALNFNTQIVAGPMLNVYNSVSANYLNIPIISAENNLSTKLSPPLMTFRHCPMKEHLNATCTKCPYNSNYKFIMQNGKEFALKRKKLSSCTFYLE